MSRQSDNQGATPCGGRAASLRPQPPAASSQSGIPSAVVAQLVEALKDSQGLIEIAMEVADELTLLMHTVGISPEARAVLRDFDGLFHATLTANKQAIALAKATGGAA